MCAVIEMAARIIFSTFSEPSEAKKVRPGELLVRWWVTPGPRGPPPWEAVQAAPQLAPLLSYDAELDSVRMSCL